MNGVTGISSSPAPAVAGTSSALLPQLSSQSAAGSLGIGSTSGAQVDESAVKKAVEQANQALAGTNERLSFAYDKRNGMMYVQVIDATTGRVREFPPKPFFDALQAGTTQDLKGLLVNKAG